MTHVTNVQTMMMMSKPETIIPVQADVTDSLPPVVRSGSSVPIFKQTVTVSQTHRPTDSEWVRWFTHCVYGCGYTQNSGSQSGGRRAAILVTYM